MLHVKQYVSLRGSFFQKKEKISKNFRWGDATYVCVESGALISVAGHNKSENVYIMSRNWYSIDYEDELMSAPNNFPNKHQSKWNDNLEWSTWACEGNFNRSEEKTISFFFICHPIMSKKHTRISLLLFYIKVQLIIRFNWLFMLDLLSTL